MREGWYDFDVFKERQRELLREAEERRLARAARPVWWRPGGYRRLLSGVAAWISKLGSRIAPSRSAPYPDEEVTPLQGGPGLVEAVFEEKVRSSSVLELRREGEGYVIREVNLSTGDNTLYLSTEESEWAAWIWDRRTGQHRSPEARA